MALGTPAEVVALLRSPLLRVRTALWLMPMDYLGCEAEEAARLRLEAVDLRQVWLKTLPEGTKYIGLTPEKLLDEVDRLTEQPGASDCVLAYNVDIFLARLRQAERKMVWEGLFTALPHRQRGLLVVMPQRAGDLLPASDQLTLWEREGRLAGTFTAG
jgi:hypothetical protein